MERQILHSDMNNFYASVECMMDMSLREKAVAVCGSQEERNGIVLAANYKAKAFGVKTGDVIWQAQQKCRDLTIVPPHYEEYMKYSAKAKEIYYRYTHQVESFGMDECWLDVTGSQQGSGYEIAEKIRQTIKFELGLTVSIGVSFNKIFAKLGSDIKKPDAVTEIKSKNFREQIWGLAVGDLLGVGRATERKLCSCNITQIGELAQLPDDLLSNWFGINGIRLKNFANGLDMSPVAEIDHSIPMKTIGHGITAIQDLETPYEVWCLMLWLSQSVGSMLIKFEKKACGVAVSVKNNQLCSQQFQCKLETPTQSAGAIAEGCFQLFKKNYPWHYPVRAVTVRAIYLEEDTIPIQQSLFVDSVKLEKREKIDRTIEDRRRRFGKNSIYPASLLNNQKMPQSEGIEITMPTGVF